MGEESEALTKVDTMAGLEAKVVARKMAKPGKIAIGKGSNGLVQASIQKSLSLSDNKMVKQGRVPKRKWGAMEETVNSNMKF